MDALFHGWSLRADAATKLWHCVCVCVCVVFMDSDVSASAVQRHSPHCRPFRQGDLAASVRPRPSAALRSLVGIFFRAPVRKHAFPPRALQVLRTFRVACVRPANLMCMSSHVIHAVWRIWKFSNREVGIRLEQNTVMVTVMVLWRTNTYKDCW